MGYRKEIDTTKELAEWYDAKYSEMGDGWTTPAEECNRHLDDLGVPFDKNLRLLDVGSGAGHFLVEAQKRVTAVGLEISEVGAQHAINRGASVLLISVENDRVKELQPFDYIVSLGSLEHIVELDKALDNIRRLLKPDGKFYFFCPNEAWKHFDQPNERNMTDDEWISLFAKHGLWVKTYKRWNDSTAFIGMKQNFDLLIHRLSPHGNKLNIGSGQRRFDNAAGWINVDCVSRPGQVPDLVCDVGKEKIPYEDGSMDCVVLWHIIEHFGCGEADSMIKECWRVLRPGGLLIGATPDLRALAQRWLTHQIDDFIFMINTFGPFQGELSDRHFWGYSQTSLIEYVSRTAEWSSIRTLTRRDIPGMEVQTDWWMATFEAVK